MAKIMLVEDDNSLREIYEARLSAEGYTIVSAKDGEEALALALKEHPDLIIADVMMPKVSGFDMLDILRSTPETKHTKIIMMTALSQAEDKARAEQLGADKYLVKSQVTLEDVTREAHAILSELEDQANATVAAVTGEPATPSAPSPAPAPAPEPTPQPTTPAPAPAAPAPAPDPKPPAASPAPAAAADEPKVTSIPVVASDDNQASAQTDDTTTDDDQADQDSKDDAQTPDDAKLEAEAKKLSTPVKKEEAEVKEQVDEIIANNPTLTTSAEPEKEDNQTASEAVDSLTKPADQAAPAAKDDSSRGYVADAGGAKPPSQSLEHTKTIEPTPGAERASATPDLNALLAKEEAAGDPTPPANTIINPNNTGGAPPTS